MVMDGKRFDIEVHYRRAGTGEPIHPDCPECLKLGVMPLFGDINGQWCMNCGHWKYQCLAGEDDSAPHVGICYDCSECRSELSIGWDSAHFTREHVLADYDNHSWPYHTSHRCYYEEATCQFYVPGHGICGCPRDCEHPGFEERWGHDEMHTHPFVSSRRANIYSNDDESDDE